MASKSKIKSSSGDVAKTVLRRIRRAFGKNPKQASASDKTPIAAGEQPAFEGSRADIEGRYSSCGDGRCDDVGAVSSSGRSTAFLEPPSSNADFGPGGSRPSSVAPSEDPEDVNWFVFQSCPPVSR